MTIFIYGQKKKIVKQAKGARSPPVWDQARDAFRHSSSSSRVSSQSRFSFALWSLLTFPSRMSVMFRTVARSLRQSTASLPRSRKLTRQISWPTPDSRAHCFATAVTSSLTSSTKLPPMAQYSTRRIRCCTTSTSSIMKHGRPFQAARITSRTLLQPSLFYPASRTASA